MAGQNRVETLSRRRTELLLILLLLLAGCNLSVKENNSSDDEEALAALRQTQAVLEVQAAALASLEAQITAAAASQTPSPTPTPSPTSTETATLTAPAQESATATSSPMASLTPSPSATPSPTFTASATFPYVPLTASPTESSSFRSIFELPFFAEMKNGAFDESLVLDNSDRPLRRLTDLPIWMNRMSYAESLFPVELDQQVPWWNIFQKAIPEFAAGNADKPVHLGLWNPNVRKTEYDSLRLNYQGFSPTELTEMSNAVTRNLVQVEYNGQTRWAFAKPIDQLDLTGILREPSSLDGGDGLARGFALTNDYETTQLAYALQFAASIEDATSLGSQQMMSESFRLMHNALSAEGWKNEGGYMPALYIDPADGKVKQLPWVLLREPIRTARVQQNPAVGNRDERADQQPGEVCVYLRFPDDGREDVADYGTEMHAGSTHLSLLVLDQAAIRSAVEDGSSVVDAIQANERPLTVHLTSEGYEFVPQSYEVSPEIMVDLTALDTGIDQAYGTNLYDNCGVAIAAPTPTPPAPGIPGAQPPGQQPPGRETQPPGGPTRTPGGPEPTPTYLPTNNPNTAPTRPPLDPEEPFNPTKVPTPQNTPVPATERPAQNPPTPKPQEPEKEPTSVFGD